MMLLVAVVGLTIGCEPSEEIQATAPTPAVKEPAAKADMAEGDKRVELNKPVEQGNRTGGYLGAVAGGYRSAREEIESWAIRQEIEHYKANTGRYPKSHEEFMEKALQSQLPEVEEGYELRYFPEEHKVFKVPIQTEPSHAVE